MVCAVTLNACMHCYMWGLQAGMQGTNMGVCLSQSALRVDSVWVLGCGQLCGVLQLRPAHNRAPSNRRSRGGSGAAFTAGRYSPPVSVLMTMLLWLWWLRMQLAGC